MRRCRAILAIWIFFAVLLAFPLDILASGTEPGAKKLIFDEAGLLDAQAYEDLNAMANQYGALRETDILIFTTRNEQNADIVKLTEDFYDQHAPGYDKPHGNTAILTMDMKTREVYLAGFYKAEQYLDNRRLDQIRSKIRPDLTKGDYRRAFQTYIQTVHEYMGIRPGVNPNNLLFNGWFQLAVSLAIGAIIVGMMVYRSGGRVTVNPKTYEDAGTSAVLEHRDQYLHTTTTKQKIQKSSGGGGGGGGGGRTGGGHSHSGSRGSF